MTYDTEALLVEELICGLEHASNPWQVSELAREFYYQRGRADVVAIAKDGTILAFEVKLTRWREALHQAYRNTCFAHESYVVLPVNAALRAEEFAQYFERRGVGICYMSEGRLIVLRASAKCSPILPWLALQASAHAQKVEHGAATSA